MIATRWCATCRDYMPLDHEHDAPIPSLFDALQATDESDRFGGETYEPDADAPRLTRQADRVFRAMRDGEWRTLAQIARETDAPEASVSARLRDLRRPRFGEHRVERRRRAGERSGTWEYRVHVNVTQLEALTSASDADT